MTRFLRFLCGCSWKRPDDYVDITCEAGKTEVVPSDVADVEQAAAQATASVSLQSGKLGIRRENCVPSDQDGFPVAFGLPVRQLSPVASSSADALAPLAEEEPLAHLAQGSQCLPHADSGLEVVWNLHETCRRSCPNVGTHGSASSAGLEFGAGTGPACGRPYSQASTPRQGCCPSPASTPTVKSQASPMRHDFMTLLRQASTRNSCSGIMVDAFPPCSPVGAPGDGRTSTGSTRCRQDWPTAPQPHGGLVSSHTVPDLHWRRLRRASAFAASGGDCAMGGATAAATAAGVGIGDDGCSPRLLPDAAAASMFSRCSSSPDVRAPGVELAKACARIDVGVEEQLSNARVLAAAAGPPSRPQPPNPMGQPNLAPASGPCCFSRDSSGGIGGAGPQYCAGRQGGAYSGVRPCDVRAVHPHSSLRPRELPPPGSSPSGHTACSQSQGPRHGTCSSSSNSPCPAGNCPGGHHSSSSTAAAVTSYQDRRLQQQLWEQHQLGRSSRAPSGVPPLVPQGSGCLAEGVVAGRGIGAGAATTTATLTVEHKLLLSQVLRDPAAHSVSASGPVPATPNGLGVSTGAAGDNTGAENFSSDVQPAGCNMEGEKVQEEDEEGVSGGDGPGHGGSCSARGAVAGPGIIPHGGGASVLEAGAVWDAPSALAEAARGSRDVSADGAGAEEGAALTSEAAFGSVEGASEGSEGPATTWPPADGVGAAVRVVRQLLQRNALPDSVVTADPGVAVGGGEAPIIDDAGEAAAGRVHGGRVGGGALHASFGSAAASQARAAAGFAGGGGAAAALAAESPEVSYVVPLALLPFTDNPNLDTAGDPSFTSMCRTLDGPPPFSPQRVSPAGTATVAPSGGNDHLASPPPPPHAKQDLPDPHCDARAAVTATTSTSTGTSNGACKPNLLLSSSGLSSGSLPARQQLTCCSSGGGGGASQLRPAASGDLTRGDPVPAASAATTAVTAATPAAVRHLPEGFVVHPHHHQQAHPDKDASVREDVSSRRANGLTSCGGSWCARGGSGGGGGGGGGTVRPGVSSAGPLRSPPLVVSETSIAAIALLRTAGSSVLPLEDGSQRSVATSGHAATVAADEDAAAQICGFDGSGDGSAVCGAAISALYSNASDDVLPRTCAVRKPTDAAAAGSAVATINGVVPASPFSCLIWQQPQAWQLPMPPAADVLRFPVHTGGRTDGVACQQDSPSFPLAQAPVVPPPPQGLRLEDGLVSDPLALVEGLGRLSYITSGAYAAVYKGTWEGTTPVAIKFLTSPSLDLNSPAVREALLGPGLEHNHIIQTFTTRVARIDARSVAQLKAVAAAMAARAAGCSPTMSSLRQQQQQQRNNSMRTTATAAGGARRRSNGLVAGGGAVPLPPCSPALGGVSGAPPLLPAAAAAAVGLPRAATMPVGVHSDATSDASPSPSAATAAAGSLATQLSAVDSAGTTGHSLRQALRPGTVVRANTASTLDSVSISAAPPLSAASLTKAGDSKARAAVVSTNSARDDATGGQQLVPRQLDRKSGSKPSPSASPSSQPSSCTSEASRPPGGPCSLAHSPPPSHQQPHPTSQTPGQGGLTQQAPQCPRSPCYAMEQRDTAATVETGPPTAARLFFMRRSVSANSRATAMYGSGDSPTAPTLSHLAPSTAAPPPPPLPPQRTGSSQALSKIPAGCVSPGTPVSQHQRSQHSQQRPRLSLGGVTPGGAAAVAATRAGGGTGGGGAGTPRVSAAERMLHVLRELRVVGPTGQPTGQEQYVTAVVMEYADAGNLDSFSRQQAASCHPATLVGLLRQVACGMCYLHAHGLVHGDLKPANILLTRDPSSQELVARVADFGLSGLSGQLGSSGGADTCGTVAYSAPERLGEECAAAEQAADVYSYGICMQQLVSGERPFAELTFAQILFGVLCRGMRPPWPTGRCDFLEQLYDQCCETQPSKRPTFDQIIAWLDALEL